MTVALADPVEAVKDVFAKESLKGWDRVDELCEVYRVSGDLRQLQRRVEKARALGRKYQGVNLSPHVRRLVSLLDKVSV